MGQFDKLPLVKDELIIKEFNKVYARFDQINERLDFQDAKLIEHDNKFDILENKLTEHDARFDRLESKITSVETKLENKIEALEIKLTQKLDLILQLLQVNTQKISVLEYRVTKLETQATN